MLEPCEGKLSRTVLRGEEGREPLALPGHYQRLMKRASALYKALLVAHVFMAGCTYGPVQERAEIINGMISTDSSALYVAVRKSSSRQPTGVSKFPDVNSLMGEAHS